MSTIWSALSFRRFFRARRGRPIRNPVRPRLESLETRLAPAVNLISGHYDNLLSGWNDQETALTPGNVNDASFGKLFSYAIDGYAYATPLYVSGLNVGGTTHNVVFVATEHDSLYAFDADNPNPATGGGLLWKRTFIDTDAQTIRPGFTTTTMPSGETLSGDIVPEIGITGTPVIDLATNTLYVVAKTKEVETATSTPHWVQRLYAIDVTTGNDALSPFLIGDTTGENTNTSPISVPGTGAGSVGGVVTFNAKKENERMALQLVPNLADGTKTVYVSWASHGDNGPYHGWVVGFDASTLAITKVFNTSPNG